MQDGGPQESWMDVCVVNLVPKATEKPSSHQRLDLDLVVEMYKTKSFHDHGTLLNELNKAGQGRKAL